MTAFLELDDVELPIRKLIIHNSLIISATDSKMKSGFEVNVFKSVLFASPLNTKMEVSPKSWAASCQYKLDRRPLRRSPREFSIVITRRLSSHYWVFQLSSERHQ